MKINKVLVVDDDSSIRTIAEISLAQVGGFEVAMVGAPTEVIAKVETEMPDLILMDVKMPGLDGPTLIGKLRENPKISHIPVILMSASITDDERMSYANLGATAVISKPFDAMRLPKELQALVENL
jgi:CheY-like chemotaxis protein